MNNERGLQLLLLLERIQNRAGCHPLRIGLSATIQSKEAALDYLSMGSCRKGKILTHCEKGRQAMVSVTTTRVGKDPFPQRYLRKILKESKDKRALLFANTRGITEEIISKVREEAIKKNLPDVYYIHHGSISKALREMTEAIMKQAEGPLLTGTTLTLELGIDIGDLDEIILACDPPSISSMVQRLGRSGRRNGRSCMSFQLRHQEDRGDLRRLDLSLVRSMAMIELYFKEYYLEETEKFLYPIELLIHTILSLFCEQGCMQPAQLAQMVLELSLFRSISQDDLRDLLHSLLDKNVLTLYEDGALGLSDVGEQLVNSLDFYAVFQAEESMSVYYNGSEIGSVTRAYRPGDLFILAGKVWEVTERELSRHRLEVKEASQIDEDAEIHTSFDGWSRKKTDRRMMEKIHEILNPSLLEIPESILANPQYATISDLSYQTLSEEDQLRLLSDSYRYLDKESIGILWDLQAKATAYQLLDPISIEKGSGHLLLCPALGTKTLTSIYHILKAHGFHCEEIYLQDLLYGIRIKDSKESLLRSFSREISKEKHMIDYGYVNRSVPCHGKYIKYLPEHLKGKEIISNFLDITGAREYFRQLF